MSQHPTPAGKPRTPTAASDAYKAAVTQLQREVGIPYSNDADRDFAALLGPYLKGTVALAKVELEHGTDPEMRRLAEQIIAADGKDAEAVRAWQAKPR